MGADAGRIPTVPVEPKWVDPEWDETGVMADGCSFYVGKKLVARNMWINRVELEAARQTASSLNLLQKFFGPPIDGGPTKYRLYRYRLNGYEYSLPESVATLVTKINWDAEKHIAALLLRDGRKLECAGEEIFIPSNKKATLRRTKI